MLQGNMPVAIGNFMLAHCFAAANDAGDNDTRQPQTGILLFFNSAPII